MARFRRRWKQGWVSPLAFFAAGLIAIAWPAPSPAQQRNLLRGPVTESEINADLLAQNTSQGQGARTTGGEEGIPTPAYRPASPGALPDEGEEGEQTRDDPFAAPQEPFSSLDRTAAPRTPSTARARSREREQNRDVEQEATREATERQQAEASEEPDDLATGTIRVGTIDAAGPETDAVRQLASERVGAIEGLERRAEENPYAPLGLRVGTFLVMPTLEQGLTWTSNANFEMDGKEALLSETTLRLNAVSDWSRHRATINAYGTYRKSVSGVEISDLEGGVDAALELDLSAEMRALATFGYTARPESASSPVIIADVDDRPLRQTIEGSLGLHKEAGKLRFGITGEVMRNQYGDATLTNGTVVSQKERNSTLAALKLRGGYQVSPAVTPFAEVEIGRRMYDQKVDTGGYERSALRLGARAGVELDIREKLTGEIAAGWIAENFDDDRLETISGLSVQGNLAWSPMRGTILRLEGSTEIESTTSPGQSGSILYTGALRLERALRSNLTGEALLGASWRDYVGNEGHDLTLAGQVGLTWWLNRYMGVTGRARHERKTSNLPGRDYDVTSVFLGVKLQR